MQQLLLGICGVAFVEEACKCWNKKKNRLDCSQTQSLSSSWVIGSRLLTAARFGRSLLYTPTHHNHTHTTLKQPSPSAQACGSKRFEVGCASARARCWGLRARCWGLRTGRGRCGLEHDVEQRRAALLCQPPPPKHPQHPGLRNFPLRQGSAGERLWGGPTKRAVDSS